MQTINTVTQPSIKSLRIPSCNACGPASDHPTSPASIRLRLDKLFVNARAAILGITPEPREHAGTSIPCLSRVDLENTPRAVPCKNPPHFWELWDVVLWSKPLLRTRHRNDQIGRHAATSLRGLEVLSTMAETYSSFHLPPQQVFSTHLFVSKEPLFWVRSICSLMLHRSLRP